MIFRKYLLLGKDKNKTKFTFFFFLSLPYVDDKFSDNNLQNVNKIYEN